MLIYLVKCNETCWMEISRTEFHAFRVQYGDDVTLKVMFASTHTDGGE